MAISLKHPNSGGLCALTSLDAVRVRLPLALEFMMTRGYSAFRSKGRKAWVTIAFDVMQVLYTAFDFDRISESSAEPATSNLAALLIKTATDQYVGSE